MFSNYTFSNLKFFIKKKFDCFFSKFFFENQKLCLKLFLKKNYIFKYLFIYLLES